MNIEAVWFLLIGALFVLMAVSKRLIDALPMTGAMPLAAPGDRSGIAGFAVRSRHAFARGLRASAVAPAAAPGGAGHAADHCADDGIRHGPVGLGMGGGSAVGGGAGANGPGAGQ
ncbi:hypothetical protein G6F57_020807 [Rhizopus arrhizus]|nr:hypothetical protein G6F57_020807 [Rhizopus arrhizus]